MFNLTEHIKLREALAAPACEPAIVDNRFAKGLAMVMIGYGQLSLDTKLAMSTKTVDCSLISRDPIRGWEDEFYFNHN